MTENHTFRRGFAALVMFTLLAGDAWRYSISWWGFGAIALALTVTAVILLVHQRHRWNFGGLPYPLIAFMVLATVSIFWSHYPGATALGLTTTWMTVTVALAVAITYSWQELLAALGVALRLILGLSILFELIVGLFVRMPVLPFWVDYGTTTGLPKLLYWSRNELFEVFDGGKIQGIVGNSSLLAFAAVLAVIVFGVQLAAGTVRRFWGMLWMLLAFATIALTRSATITVILVVVAVVVLAALLIRRASTPRGRVIVYWSFAGAVALSTTLAVMFSGQLLGLLGKSEDLTGRLGIWDKVIDLAGQQPVAGWGWVSYWVPWVSPFDDLVTRNGVLQLHAHNAWLDIWLQLGILGLIVFGALVLSTAFRAWSLATDRPQSVPGSPGPYSAVTVLPLLLLTALLVQSLAESRLIVEYGMLLLVIIAVKTKAPGDRISHNHG